jgi:hypothetical protein
MSPTQRRWLTILTVSTLVIWGVMLWMHEELRTKGAPLGVVSLELAGNIQTARRIVMHEWTFRHRIIAAFGLGLDFLSIASYATWLYLGCRWSAERWLPFNESRAKQIQLVAWLAVAAGGFDIVENIVLFDFIHSDGKSPAYPIAFWSAILKFVLLGIVLTAYGSGLLARAKSTAAAEKKPVPVPVPIKKQG